ncbi:MAG: replicative DNA helicase [Phycisphaerae bacterium]|jgi:replicative DNA helicase
MEKSIGRIPPYSEDAERSVLGCMLINPEAAGTVIESLSGNAFYLNGHGAIYKAMLSLYNQGKSIDMVTVTEELRGMDALSIAGGGSYIAELANYVPSVSGIEGYIQIVKEKYIRREIIQAATEAANMAYIGREDEAAILEKTEARFLKLSQTRETKEYTSFDAAIMCALDSIDRAGKGGGIKTRFIDFDRMTTGLWPGDYMILAARPSMGKTALMLNIAYNIAVHDRVPIGIFSIEQNTNQLTQRILSKETNIPLMLIRSGNINDGQWEQLDGAASRLSGSPIFIDEKAVTPIEIRSQARRLVSRHGVKLIMVDYLQLMKTSGRPENRTVEVSEISRSFKLLAKELNIPIIVLSQLSRAPEQRGKKRPQLSDLRESGAIEQDADIVTFLYRPAYYDKTIGSDNTEEAEWIIEKQRSGPTGTIWLRWFPEKTTFHNAIDER